MVDSRTRGIGMGVDVRISRTQGIGAGVNVRICGAVVGSRTRGTGAGVDVRICGGIIVLLRAAGMKGGTSAWSELFKLKKSMVSSLR